MAIYEKGQMLGYAGKVSVSQFERKNFEVSVSVVLLLQLMHAEWDNFCVMSVIVSMDLVHLTLSLNLGKICF